MIVVYSIRHTGLCVNCLVKSIKFYERLGFKVINKGWVSSDDALKLHGLPNGSISWVKLATETMQILELFKSDNNAVYAPGIHGSHIALSVFNIQESWAFFFDKGLCISQGIVTDNEHKLFFAKDPDGHVIEVVETPK